MADAVLQVAMEYALTGDFFSATDAHRFGLVNRVTLPGGALSGAVELAERITANAPLAIAGLAQGSIFHRDGTPIATVVQEGLAHSSRPGESVRPI